MRAGLRNPKAWGKNWEKKKRSSSVRCGEKKRKNRIYSLMEKISEARKRKGTREGGGGEWRKGQGGRKRAYSG